MDNTSNLFEKIKSNFNGKLSLAEDGQALYAEKEIILDLLNDLKNNEGYIMLTDITSADYDDHFEVLYHVMRLDANIIRIKVKLPRENPTIASSISVWKAANVLEREVYDLMGIVFEGHNNLKRILCPDDFEGHPLRKDYKLDIIDRFSEGK